jgi:hypothetical protein
MTTDRQGDVDLISKCRDESESEIDRRVEILHEINSELPQSKQVRIPSLITNDYVNRALDIVESAG